MWDLDEEIRSHLLRVSEGETGIENFERWLVEHTWDKHSDLAACLSLVLAERDLIDEAELLNELNLAASASSTTTIQPMTSASTTTREFLGHFNGSQTIRQSWGTLSTPPAAVPG